MYLSQTPWATTSLGFDSGLPQQPFRPGLCGVQRANFRGLAASGRWDEIRALGK